MSNMDELALFSSEIFREYAKNEQVKEAQQIRQEEIDKNNSLKQFSELQKRINASPKLRAHFKKIQAALMENEEYRAKADPKFVEGVLLLNLEGE
jgi:NifU-like protein involved in Fe-S cluster formation